MSAAFQFGFQCFLVRASSRFQCCKAETSMKAPLFNFLSSSFQLLTLAVTLSSSLLSFCLFVVLFFSGPVISFLKNSIHFSLRHLQSIASLSKFPTMRELLDTRRFHLSNSPHFTKFQESSVEWYFFPFISFQGEESSQQL